MPQLRSARGAGWLAVELLSVPLFDDIDESVVLAGAVAGVLIELFEVVGVTAALVCATAAPMTASKAAAAAAADNFFW
jgi:hypothetical protein